MLGRVVSRLGRPKGKLHTGLRSGKSAGVVGPGAVVVNGF